MEYIKINKEEKNVWLDSKDLNKGFFVVNEWTDYRPEAGYVYNPYTDFTQKTTVEYYTWIKQLKMGDLSNISDEVGYFDYLIYNDYLKLDDSLIIQTLNWNNNEDDKQAVYDEITSNFNEFHNEHSFPIQEYSRIRDSEFMENIEKYWTITYGFFDLNATLKEQEDFANVIVDEIFENWEDEHDEEDENDTFELENWTDEDNLGIGSIVEYIKEQGGKINHI